MTHLNRYTFFLVALLVLLANPIVYAGPISLLLESDENSQGGEEVFVARFETTDDLLNNTLSSNSAFSDLNISTNFSIGGFAYDGNSYQLLLESDENEQTGDEVFLASFDSIEDLLSGDLSTGIFSSLNISAQFSIGGFAYDGLAYRLLLETDDNEQTGDEVFLASFDSIDDLLSGDLSAGIFSDININADFSIGGFAFEDGLYQMLLESDENEQTGDEVFLASYASLDDLINNSLGSGTFSSLNIADSFSIGGFAYDFTIDDPVDVPASPTLLLTLFGLFGLFGFRESSRTLGLVNK